MVTGEAGIVIGTHALLEEKVMFADLGLVVVDEQHRFGFELSRIALEQRREGDVLGASQSGLRSSLDSLRVLRDEKTIIAARAAAEEMVATDPTLGRWPLLAAEVDVWERDSKSAFMERS